MKIFASLMVAASLLFGSHVASVDVGHKGANPLTHRGSTLRNTLALAESGPYHIATWAYDEYNGQGSHASAADVFKLLSYAETGPGNQKALLDCHSTGHGCKAVLYFDPNKAYDSPGCPYKEDSDLLIHADETWFIHQAGFNDATHRVHGTYNQICQGTPATINVWAINISSPGVQAYFKDFLQRVGDAYDLYYLDDMGASLVDQFYFSGKGGCDETGKLCRSTQEYAEDHDLHRGASSFLNALNHRNGTPMYFIFNGLSFNNRPVADVRLLDVSSRLVGASCEGCATSGTAVHPNNYPRILNTMAEFNKRERIFVLLSNGNAPSGSPAQLQQRFVTIALVWLGYQDNRTVVWPNLETKTKNLAVWPEDMIYPSKPVQTMQHGATDLEVAPHVWRREFETCYDRGVVFGHCAVILNGGDAEALVSGSWLSGAYGHVVTLSGGDELSGGRESINGDTFKAGQTIVPAHGALLLAQ